MACFVGRSLDICRILMPQKGSTSRRTVHAQKLRENDTKTLKKNKLFTLKHSADFGFSLWLRSSRSFRLEGWGPSELQPRAVLPPKQLLMIQRVFWLWGLWDPLFIQFYRSLFPSSNYFRFLLIFSRHFPPGPPKVPRLGTSRPCVRGCWKFENPVAKQRIVHVYKETLLQLCLSATPNTPRFFHGNSSRHRSAARVTAVKGRSQAVAFSRGQNLAEKTQTREVSQRFFL